MDMLLHVLFVMRADSASDCPLYLGALVGDRRDVGGIVRAPPPEGQIRGEPRQKVPGRHRWRVVRAEPHAWDDRVVRGEVHRDILAW